MFERDVQFLAALRLLEPPRMPAPSHVSPATLVMTRNEPTSCVAIMVAAHRRGDDRFASFISATTAAKLNRLKTPAYTDILRSFSRTSNVMRRSGFHKHRACQFAFHLDGVGP